MPDHLCLVIFLINRYKKSFFRQFQYINTKFPCPFDSLFLKIVTERPVSKHFKECTVSCCFTDIFDITCTDTLLTVSHSSLRRLFLSCKIWLQWCHSGIDKKQAVIVSWYKRKALYTKMLLAFKEFKIKLSQLIKSHPLHKNIHPFKILYNKKSPSQKHGTKT